MFKIDEAYFLSEKREFVKLKLDQYHKLARLSEIFLKRMKYTHGDMRVNTRLLKKTVCLLLTRWQT